MPALGDSFDENSELLPLTGICTDTIKTVGPSGTLATIVDPEQQNSVNDAGNFEKCLDLVGAVEELASRNTSSILKPKDIPSAAPNITVASLAHLDPGCGI